MIGAEVYLEVLGRLGVAVHLIRPYQYLTTRLHVLDSFGPDDGDATTFRNV